MKKNALIAENTTRKMDKLGRVTIPKSLRDRMYLSPNDTVEVYTLQLDGELYICLKSKDSLANRCRAAETVFNELGVKLPDEVKDKLEAAFTDEERD